MAISTYSQVLDDVAVLMGDAAQDEYTDAVLLPYLNMSMRELEEVYELNNIPSTNETSAKLDVPANTSVIAFSSTTPTLPVDLIEIRELWCSSDGQNKWFPVDKREYLTSEELPAGSTVQFFNVWAWMEQEIRLIASSVALDIKIDYIRYLFARLAIGDIGQNLSVLNSHNTLMYRTAGLAAEFVAENKTRADELNAFALNSLNTNLGISTKGKQTMVFRRRPFRASWKRRGVLI